MHSPFLYASYILYTSGSYIAFPVSAYTDFQYYQDFMHSTSLYASYILFTFGPYIAFPSIHYITFPSSQITLPSTQNIAFSF
jgi:hypothetical protein